MSDLLLGGTLMLGQAAFLGGVLAIANRWVTVAEDPRIGVVEGMLPGSNCGACGLPGCRALAEAIVSGTERPAGCTVSPPEGIEWIAAFLGVDAGQRERRVARLLCAGGTSVVSQLADYRGWPSCRAAFVVNGGGKACSWGCLGLGDCERVCDFRAIAMSADRLPVVDPSRCTACGDCVEGCPLHLFTLEAIDDQRHDRRVHALALLQQCLEAVGRALEVERDEARDRFRRVHLRAGGKRCCSRSCSSLDGVA